MFHHGFINACQLTQQSDDADTTAQMQQVSEDIPVCTTDHALLSRLSTGTVEYDIDYVL
jgi:hypothetical protein